MMKCLSKTIAVLAVSAFAGGMIMMAAGTAHAKTITIRIASGHPPAVVYAGLMKDYFQAELKKRVEERTEHKINFVEGYSGSIVKVYETFEGVRDGIVDIGGFCYCFEPSNLKLHAFQVMLPFGTMDPTISLKVAQDVYREVPYLTNVFEEKFNQKLLARIADGGYNLGTSFDWNKVSDLKGVKIAGAGLNLNWLKYAGVTPVQGSLPEAYTGMKTHIYEGWIMFPSAWVNLKLYEPGPFYTLIGFGSITWHAMTANGRGLRREDRLQQQGALRHRRREAQGRPRQGQGAWPRCAPGMGPVPEGLAAGLCERAGGGRPAGEASPQPRPRVGREARIQVAGPLRHQIGVAPVDRRS
jgi:TRAP-type C4-dicarboxylate transport system substrate-binding protein